MHIKGVHFFSFTGDEVDALFCFLGGFSMIFVIVGAVVLLADTFFLYCCLRVASEADRQIEEEFEKHEKE